MLKHFLYRPSFRLMNTDVRKIRLSFTIRAAKGLAPLDRPSLSNRLDAVKAKNAISAHSSPRIWILFFSLTIQHPFHKLHLRIVGGMLL